MNLRETGNRSARRIVTCDQSGSDSFERYLHAVAPLQPFRDRKSLLAQEIRIEQLRLIARAEICKNRNDGVAWPHLVGEPDRAGHVDAGRAAHAQPLVLEQVENHRYRLLV